MGGGGAREEQRAGGMGGAGAQRQDPSCIPVALRRAFGCLTAGALGGPSVGCGRDTAVRRLPRGSH